MGAVVFFAFILFVMGGVTAYMGDRMGSYIGKKRHSTFGLRPRHTAMLWTVMSGGVIAVGTLLLFVALNRTFSTALVRGPQLVATNSLLEKQNFALTRHNLATELQAQADTRRAAQAQKNADFAQAGAIQAQAMLSKVSAQLGSAQAMLAQSRATLAQSRATLAQRQTALAAAQTHLAEAHTRLDGTRTDLAKAKMRVQVARAGVHQALKQYQIANNQVVQANRSVLALVQSQDRLHAENIRLVRLNGEQKNLLQASQGHSLIFHREEELGRTVVSATQNPESVRRELAVFLDQVELTARQRGAGGLDNAPALVIPTPGETLGSFSEAREAALDALTQNITAQGGFMPSIVVVAAARYNTFTGEAVRLDLRPYANVMVFPKGTVIASINLDGTQSEDVILKRLQAFLTDQVRQTAIRRNIIPTYDPQSGQTLVGQPIDTATALDLVKQIQEAGPNAHVTASVRDDTYSADLLHLDLRVTSPVKPAVSAVVE
jgi:uncharacterized protein (DUF3084 family)